jgi:3',5'-cyclic AMP phosphodiesterase CpdA
VLRPLKIAHISDLHVGDHDESMWTKLQENLWRQQPHLLFVTGDIVEDPSEENFSTAMEKLRELCTQCAIDEKDVYIVPGNHDYRIYGIFSLGRFSPSLFNNVFEKWLHSSGSGVFDENKGIALFFFDSNFSLKFIDAGGKIRKQALNKFNEECNRLEKKPGYGTAVKIALLHHHPIPIPYSQQFERLMVLDNAGEFLRHLSQKGIDIILHGHKHHRVVLIYLYRILTERDVR